MKPTVVCLCGSTRFKKEFIEANFRETMAGRIVLSVGWFGHADADVYALTTAEKAALDRLHLAKIDLADEIFVINQRLPRCPECLTWAAGVAAALSVQGFLVRCVRCDSLVEETPYVGESTRKEIEYAKSLGKRIRYLNEPS